MKIDTPEEPRAPCAQATSACTARMFHWRAKRTAPAGLALLATPPSAAASGADNWGTSRAIPTSASTAWIPRPPASVAGPDPLRPLTAASPLPGDTHSTVPPSAVTRAPKSAGTAPENDTMCRPVPAPLVAAVLTVIAESRGAGRAAGAKGMRESLRQALAANAPRTANREAERTSDTGRLARKRGTGKLLPHAEAREYAIEHIVGRHHADQVVQRPDRGAQMGRGRGGVHAAVPRNLKRLDFRERTLQRLAVACARDDRLHVTQREQAAVGDLGELATEIRETLSGHDRHVETAGRVVQEVGLRHHLDDRCAARRKKLPRARISHLVSRIPTEEDQVRSREILAAHLDPHALDPIVALPQSGRVDEPERKPFEHRVRLDRIPRGARDLRHDGAFAAEQRVEQRRLTGVGTAGDDEQRPLAQPLPLGGRGDEVRDPLARRAPRALDPLGRHRTFVLLGEIDLVGEQGLELDQLGPELLEPPGQPAVELLQRAPRLRGRAGG